MNAYEDFLRAKVVLAEDIGLPCEPHEVNPLLKPHQVAMVCWAVRGGRRAIFAAFGLGKSVIQLEIVRITRAKAGGMGYGCELSPRYFLDGVTYCEAAEREMAMPDLFAGLDAEAGAEREAA